MFGSEDTFNDNTLNMLLAHMRGCKESLTSLG